MIMKTIYKTFLTLMAALSFGPVVSAQAPYLINKEKGIGYNKSIYTDPETGEHSIRIETFAMGGGEPKAIPSDIVLVLDNSGSMLYYYVLDPTKYKSILTQEEVNAPTLEGKDPLLVKETQYYLGSYTAKYASNQTTVGATNTISWPTAFLTENKSGDGTYTDVRLGRYAKYNGKYYRVFYRSEGGNYYLCFRLEDSTLMYLSGDEFTATKPTTAVTSDQTVIFRGSEAKGTLLYRSKNRMEKLLEGVHAFVKEIYDNNQIIAGDLAGKVGNQIAIVSFGSNKDMEKTNTSATENCQIIKSFTPVVTSTGAADTTSILNALNIMNFKGNTSIGRGIRLATDAFTDLRNLGIQYDAYEMNENGTYKKDEADHPIVNRSKVVVLFTDGTPTSESAFNSSNPYNYGSGTSTNHTKNRAVYFSNLIKKTGEGQINGKIFTVGLNPPAEDENFLRHLSSNYPTSQHTSDDTYTPENPSKDLYYMDAGTKDLKEVFKVIASIAGGSSTVDGSSMVNIDIVSKSFQIPRGEASDDLAQKIKVYTAQCLGLDPEKTYVEDGVTKHYLAFAEPVEAGERDALDILWTSTTNETTEEVTWTRETNVDVDGQINVVVDDDASGQNDVIKVRGFDYAKFWCGMDGDSLHQEENTEDYVPSDYGDYYAGTGSYIKGYRGFKIIIEIPISLKEDAVGGPSVQTNEYGSGLADEHGEPIIRYPIPEITIPVNLWIQKEGLKKGESASFTIQRKLSAKADESDSEPEYEYYTNVIVSGETDADGNSKPVMVKMYNLDPKYYYKVLEDGWSWAYDKDPSAAPTTETVIKNPIVIKNTPKNNMPKHAESVVYNDFGAGTAVTTSTKEHYPVTTP